MANSDNLRKAKENKNDEFYTRLEDIEDEISMHPDYVRQFQGKTVFCNCDDLEWSKMNNETQGRIVSELVEELRVEGVYCKGYGIIPKAAMFDKDLSIEAKAIYSYFCSLSGSGDSTFSSRSRILSDLSICKDVYYRAYKELQDNDYIRVTQSNIGRYEHNVYTLSSLPAKYNDKSRELSVSDTVIAKIRCSGLKAGGYGLIPKTVMTDPRLTIKAKGVYSFFSSLTGSGSTAFPQKQTVLEYLNIKDGVYDKSIKSLVMANYISVVQRHENGRFGVNDIELVDTPNPENADKKHTIAKYCSGRA